MIKKLHLELGGKDPMVIAPDAEMDMAVSGLAYAALINTGQVCTSTERVYVHESIMAQFSEELADFVSKLRLGNGMDEGVFRIEHLYLLKQTGSFGHTEMDQASVAELMEQLISEGKTEEAKSLKCWVHSHPGGMGVFWSQTDSETCRSSPLSVR